MAYTWPLSNKKYISQYQEKILEKYREKLIELIDEYKVFTSTLFDSLKDKNTTVPKVTSYYYDGSDIGNVSDASQRQIQLMVIRARNAYDDALSSIVYDDKNSFNASVSNLVDFIDAGLKAMYDTGIMPEKLATIDWI